MLFGEQRRTLLLLLKLYEGGMGQSWYLFTVSARSVVEIIQKRLVNMMSALDDILGNIYYFRIEMKKC